MFLFYLGLFADQEEKFSRRDFVFSCSLHKGQSVIKVRPLQSCLTWERWSSGGMSEGSRGHRSILIPSFCPAVLPLRLPDLLPEAHSSSLLVWRPLFPLEAGDSLQSGKARVSISPSNSLWILSFLYFTGSFGFSFSRIHTLVPPSVVERAEWAVFTDSAGRKRTRRRGRRKKRNSR